MEFFNVLTSPELLTTTEALLPEHREPLQSPTVTLSMLMSQVLQADNLCLYSVRTGGFCWARQRLPVEMVSALTRQTCGLLNQKALASWLWRGRMVKLSDGTGLSMPNTRALER